MQRFSRVSGLLATLVSLAQTAMQPSEEMTTAQPKRRTVRGYGDRWIKPSKGRAGDKLARKAAKGKIGIRG